MSIQVECASCKQSHLDLTRCAGCNDVFYCSQECQRKHWVEDHKVKCKGKFKLGEGQQDKENQLSLANLSIASDLNCMEPMMEKGETTCDKCGGNTGFDACANCRNMFYRIREHQKQEWKRQVQSTNDDTGFLDFMAFLRLTEIYGKETITIKTFKEAVGVANILFHGRWKIIDDLREISSESKINMNIQKQVFVGNIHRMHPMHFHQHGFYIQDSRGGETNVRFYLKNDDPAPYFQWNDLHPRRFICIICPVLHHLRDKHTGFRIRDPSEIRLLKL
ncbi:hypothetical protein ACJMK2_017686 [Sinanodonta woodiana]|uniref:MYND-type domain-containing protein n=1 Tax=Sinanodonta woodiana TaxID=1069815 RepID=A0ABD3UCN1_SINWO